VRQECRNADSNRCNQRAGFKRIALITDGRFSGGTSGLCISHIEPEAYLSGNIGAIKDRGIIEISIRAGALM